MTEERGRHSFLVRFAVAIGTIGVLQVIASAIGWDDVLWLGIGTVLVAAVLLSVGLRRSAPARQVT